MSEFRFVIDTPKPLSSGRIAKYLIQFEKLLGVKSELVKIENAEWPSGKMPRTKERSVPETSTDQGQISAKDASLP